MASGALVLLFAFRLGFGMAFEHGDEDMKIFKLQVNTIVL